MSPKRLCPSFAKFQGGVEQVLLVPTDEFCQQWALLCLLAADSKIRSTAVPTRMAQLKRE